MTDAVHAFSTGKEKVDASTEVLFGAWSKPVKA